MHKELKGRKLSIVDSTSIHLAKKLGIGVISGDRDLTSVANRMGIRVIW